MKEIKRMDVLSVGKIYALTMAIIGFIAGIIIALIGGAITTFDRPGMWGAGLGIASIIILPIVYAIFGFLLGIIGAALYNLIAKWVGGIKIELKD
ncbi:MAG TPA: DUF3566 domain-containing protein [Bacteroidales bacterium]|nr:DUF3566 domain-containing protein [Bacteroidales bacterium]